MNNFWSAIRFRIKLHRGVKVVRAIISELWPKNVFLIRYQPFEASRSEKKIAQNGPDLGQSLSKQKVFFTKIGQIGIGRAVWREIFAKFGDFFKPL